MDKIKSCLLLFKCFSPYKICHIPESLVIFNKLCLFKFHFVFICSEIFLLKAADLLK